ncbi:Myb-like DNA-binding domain-containing protein [Spironucleus salmonicida]|uniref:Myb-like DNA-binding domain-containing protein n=1 Tax=Spironucleus salmonicida TaxID=348837 RepID=V6LH65_9EUKA|nr:Myb-like DNA-binding domain-containing protein [Spironucleus salmonicida]|eukprot:EST43900.1 Myb-like DNA-binding domain-containing protein [Spironucleus salmonicida]
MMTVPDFYHKWTESEAQQLLEHVKIHGTNWKILTKKFYKNFKPLQIKNKYYQLRKHQETQEKVALSTTSTPRQRSPSREIDVNWLDFQSTYVPQVHQQNEENFQPQYMCNYETCSAFELDLENNYW